MFFIAYTLDGVNDAAKRPVTFSFNGGPGSSSVWLHLGVLGPRRVDMGEHGDLPAPTPGQNRTGHLMAIGANPDQKFSPERINPDPD